MASLAWKGFAGFGLASIPVSPSPAAHTETRTIVVGQYTHRKFPPVFLCAQCVGEWDGLLELRFDGWIHKSCDVCKVQPTK